MSTLLESMTRAIEDVHKEYKREQRKVALGKKSRGELNLLFEALRQGRECATTLITLQLERRYMRSSDTSEDTLTAKNKNHV